MSEIPEGPILDYASPTSRSPLRLAKRSIIYLYQGVDEVKVVERLAEQGKALTAIIFSGSMVVLLGYTTEQTERPERFIHYFSEGFILYFIYAAATLALILAVIYVNWRSTILEVSRERVILRFESAFKNLMYQWPSSEVRNIHVVQELDQRTMRIIFELRIELAFHPMLRLFGGHEIQDLNAIAMAMREQLAAPESGT
jgi:hypothetical protein